MTSILSSLKTAFPYTPTHAGMKRHPSAQPLVEKAAVDSPSATKPSRTKSSLSDLAKAAREKMNDSYAKLGMVGDIHTTMKQWKTIGFSGFDRQTLYAISSNEGGMFNEHETSQAHIEVISRARAAGRAANLSGQNFTAHFRAMIDFYDQASPEEKSSFKWMELRANAQISYEWSGGRENVNVEGENPILDMLLKGWDQLREAGYQKWFGKAGQQSEDKDLMLVVTEMPAYREALMEWSRQNQNAPILDMKV